MNKLLPTDLYAVLRRLPKDVAALLRETDGLYLAGGFIRAVIAGETPSDIDLFGRTNAMLQEACARLASERTKKGERAALHQTKNARTVLTPSRMPVQFIHRWLFESPRETAESFDFTVCSAVVFFDTSTRLFSSWCHPKFYFDLAAKRLVYTSPSRNEDAGGSLMRALKYTRRGYHIQATSLGAVCARLVRGVREPAEVFQDEQRTAFVLAGLLREVDPLLVIDGLEPTGDESLNEESAA